MPEKIEIRIPKITTERLVLRAFTHKDALTLFDILQVEGVLRYFPDPIPPSRERVERFIERQLAHWEEHGFGWWAVVPQGGEELIGWNGLQFIPETDEIELGYLLSKPFWGQGLAVEGGQAALEFGFETLGLERIIGLVHPDNIASQRVLEKLGMTFTNQASYFGMQVYRYALERADHVW